MTPKSIDIVRTFKPSLIAQDIVGVQPLSAPTGQTLHGFKMNYVSVTIDCEFCGKPACELYNRIIKLHSACFEKFPNSRSLDYYIIAKKSSSSVESFFQNILISEYMYELNKRIDYFSEKSTELTPMTFKQDLLSLRYDLYHPDKTPYVTEDSLADHGVYFYG